MRVLGMVLLLTLVPSLALPQSRDGLCDLVVMEVADQERISRLLAETGSPFVRCYDGYTPIHVAVSAGNLPAIRQLAESGNDLNARNDYGSTPLHVAILASDPRAVELLLDLGADIHSFGPDAMSPLAFARNWGEAEIVQILLARGARM